MTPSEISNKTDNQLNQMLAETLLNMSGDKDVQRLFNEGKLDYCNSPSLTIPLMFERGISLLKLGNSYLAVAKDWDWIDLSRFDSVDDCCVGDIVNKYGHSNPLRAVVIVLLCESTNG